MADGRERAASVAGDDPSDAAERRRAEALHDYWEAWGGAGVHPGGREPAADQSTAELFAAVRSVHEANDGGGPSTAFAARLRARLFGAHAAVEGRTVGRGGRGEPRLGIVAPLFGRRALLRGTAAAAGLAALFGAVDAGRWAVVWIGPTPTAAAEPPTATGRSVRPGCVGEGESSAARPTRGPAARVAVATATVAAAEGGGCG